MDTRQTPDAVREALERQKAVNTVLGRLLAPLVTDVVERMRIGNEACTAILDALDSRAGDAGEDGGKALFEHEMRQRGVQGLWADLDEDEREGWRESARVVLSATPAPAVDAVPAGEVERLARIRTSMALLQQNSEGCALNHYGDDATVHGTPGWLIDTKADLDAFTDLLAKWEAAHG